MAIEISNLTTQQPSTEWVREVEEYKDERRETIIKIAFKILKYKSSMIWKNPLGLHQTESDVNGEREKKNFNFIRCEEKR